MRDRLPARLSHGRVVSRLIPVLALGALLGACHDAERSLAPRVNGPRFSLSAEGLNGKIAFHSNRDGDFQIYVMNPDGSDVTRVTNTAGGNVDPIWSPDGKRIAFASFRSGRSEVFVINVDGTGETQLTTEGGFPGAWSPDGTRIAFANSSDGDDEIFILHLDGSGVTRLTDNPFRDFPTAWSPNGEQILFQSDRDGDEEIYVMNVDGSGVTRLTNSPGRDEGDRAGWSPNAKQIVFSSDRDAGHLHLFVMNPDGSGVTQLTSGNFVDDDPVWSPDGTRIAFHSTRDGPDEDIFVMNADGSGVTQLTFNDAVFDAVPVWTQLVSASNDAFANATVIAALPFSEAVDLTTATAEPLEPSSSCQVFVGPVRRSVWYTFTPPQSEWLSARIINAAAGGVVAVYTGDSFDNLTEIGGGVIGGGCDWQGKRLAFEAEGGRRYHFQVRGVFDQSTSLQFRLDVIPPPLSDAFANATAIPEPLPFSDVVDVAAATLEPGEPRPSCTFGSVPGTAWYRFTPTVSRSVTASTFFPQFSATIAAYAGSALTGLTEKGCTAGFGGRVTFRAEAGTAYYFQVGGQSLPGQPDNFGPVEFRLEVTPDPIAGLSFFPSDASVFDNVQFFDNSFDPAFVGVQVRTWTFGDGTSTTTTDCCVTHQYAADGSYAVRLTITTFDGRTASTAQTVIVQTHDVAITRLAVPQTGRSGQTRRLTVSINSRRYPETVDVQLFRSVSGGFQQFGSLTQSVPMNLKNGTTDFAFSYTFTAGDAQIGKVTFRAVAVIGGARDVLPADNEAIAAPTKVTR